MKTTKTLGKKNCSVGATCKGTCISKAKDCLVTLSPKNKKRISDAVRKLKAGSSDKNRRATIEKAEKEFIKKGGSVPAAAKLLTTLLGNKGPEYKGSGPENLKAVINDFYKLTGRTQRLKTITTGDGRSQADRRNESIKISNKANAIQARKEIFHELFHFAAQSTPKAKQSEKDFINSRKTGEPKYLNEITGKKVFGLEKAYPGKFPNSYTGKWYGSGATEVFSTGGENFSSASDLSKFYKSDPEHFQLIMKYIKGDL